MIQTSGGCSLVPPHKRLKCRQSSAQLDIHLIVPHRATTLRGVRDQRKRRGSEPLPQTHRHMGLEVELKSHLDLARRIDLTLDVPEATTVEGRVDIAELRVVKRVESFHPELQPRTF